MLTLSNGMSCALCGVHLPEEKTKVAAVTGTVLMAALEGGMVEGQIDSDEEVV
jgi:surface antigen